MPERSGIIGRPALDHIQMLLELVLEIPSEAAWALVVPNVALLLLMVPVSDVVQPRLEGLSLSVPESLTTSAANGFVDGRPVSHGLEEAFAHLENAEARRKGDRAVNWDGVVLHVSFAAEQTSSRKFIDDRLLVLWSCAAIVEPPNMFGGAVSSRSLGDHMTWDSSTSEAVVLKIHEDEVLVAMHQRLLFAQRGFVF